EQALALAVTFGDPQAFARLRADVADPAADDAKRQAALAALLGAKDAQLVPVLHRLVADPRLAGAALRGLALYDDPATPGVILGAYATLGPAEKRDALATLAARPASAKALLDAIAAKKLPNGDVPAELVRQLGSLRDPEVERR